MISAASTSSLAAGVQALGAAATAASKAAPTPSEQKRDQAAKAKLQDFQSALTTLKSLNDSAKSTAAGMAAQKLEALKQRLKMLMMFGGDPKEIAKEAAQIAKEIGEAAKDYAAAAGGDSGGSQAAAPAAGPAVSAGADLPAPAAGATTATAADPAVVATAEPAANPGAAAKTAADPAQPAGNKPADAAKTGPANPDAKPAATKGASRASGPDPVLEEAKQLAAKAKAILKAAIEKAKLQHADPAELQDDRDKMSAAEKSIRDAEKALGADDSSAGYSAGGEAVAAPAATAPSVSVQA
jgi:hypothetical protein